MDTLEPELQGSRDRTKLFSELYHQLTNESDRGAVIVATVLFDDLLQNLIMARLVPAVERDDELFSSAYAPLSSFAVKIDLAYRIGLIGQSPRSSLHLIRRLRNAFAHTPVGTGFASQSVQSRVRELFKLNLPLLEAIWSVLRNSDEPWLAKDIVLTDSTDSMSALVRHLQWRGVFDLFVAVIVVHLSQVLKGVVPLHSCLTPASRCD